MYAEHCEEELRICYHTNCGLLYPETIKKVLNLNRNDDLKDYLEGISESVKWKALHNLLQSNINPLKRQLMDLKCMKMLLTNASVNNERVVSTIFFPLFQEVALGGRTKFLHSRQ